MEPLITDRTKAICAVHYAGYPAALEELSRLCEHHGVALIEDAAHSPSARTRDGSRSLGTVGLAGAFSFFSNKVLSCGEGGALATDSDEVAELARSLRSHAMTSGTWDRHRGRSATYDVTGLGFNYRMDEPRAALLAARLLGLEDDIAARRRIVRRYRAALADAARRGGALRGRRGGPELLLRDARRCSRTRSCAIRCAQHLLERHRVQTSVLYPAIHEFSAYAGEAHGPLPQSEFVARAEITMPLYPDLSDADQDRVIVAFRESLPSSPAPTPARRREHERNGGTRPRADAGHASTIRTSSTWRSP